MYFIFLVVFIIFLIYHRYKLYTDKFQKIESYDNLFSNQNISPYYEIENKKLYALEHDTLEKIPVLKTSFKYSLEFKLGYELSKIFRIQNQDTPGLLHNLNNFNPQDKSLFLCSETDYYQYLKEKRINSQVLKFICAFYYQHLLMIVREGLDIDSYPDLSYYLNKNNKKEREILKIGIANSDSNSHSDAIKIFNILGYDIQKQKKGKYFQIIDTYDEKNLFNLLSQKKIDLIYLTTSVKHPYLIDYLTRGDFNIFSTQTLQQNLLQGKYDGNHLFQHRISKNNFTKIVKKKNIYDTTNGIDVEVGKLINNEKERNIIGPQFIDVKSTRVILVSSMNISAEYIKLFLRNIYGKLDSLRVKLNNYLLIPEKQNYLTRPLDPYEMSYCQRQYPYHPGAEDFYREIQLITDEKGLKNNIFVEENKYFS